MIKMKRICKIAFIIAITVAYMPAVKGELTVHAAALYWRNMKVSATSETTATVSWSQLTSSQRKIISGKTVFRNGRADAIDFWAETDYGYEDQGHRGNMLSRDATRVGIACYIKDGHTCWTMYLGY